MPAASCRTLAFGASSSGMMQDWAPNGAARSFSPGHVTKPIWCVSDKRPSAIVLCTMTRLLVSNRGFRGASAGAFFFPDEGHMAPRRALSAMTGRLRSIGSQVNFSDPVPEPVWMAAGAGEIVIDCRGIAAREELKGLRGVRGEMAVVQAEDLGLSRPIRLLHPRSAIYVVPWGDDIYMIGATSIESEYAGPVTLRSSLDLLGTACALHPGFAQARIIEFSAGVRPAFPDNIPKIIKRGRRLIVNGAYRHGFLLAPVLAEAVANHLEYDEPLPDAFVLRDADCCH